MAGCIAKIDIEKVILIAREAGGKIMDVYKNENLFVEKKEDSSPITLADKLSHLLITERLSTYYPDIPVVSEEESVDYSTRKDWQHFWLVDPLDGTKEFISRNGEFTVNIALISEHEPVLGAIYVPVMQETYYAVKGSGAYKIERDGRRVHLKTAEGVKDGSVTVVASRSHNTKEVEEYVAELKKKFKSVDYVSAGSSLKFCLVAEGKAQIYPRLGPTMEWDTAAGQIIVEEAGGALVDKMSLKSISYNRERLVNSSFIVSASSIYY